MRTDQPKTIWLKDYTPPAYRVEHTDLTVRIFPGTTEVAAKLTVHRPGDAAAVPFVLNGENIDLLSVSLDGRVLAEGVDYVRTDKTLTISAPPASFALETLCRIAPEENTALEGLYCSQGTYCTQCEAEGFRRITYYPDRPDVMATFTVRVEADRAACPVLLSNGDLIEEGDLPEGRHFTVWHDPFPKPCYLFALVAGDLECIQDTFRTVGGKDVDLRIYVRSGDEDQVSHAMESLKHSMRWDERVYGREYDLTRFNIVAISDFNMGAMENKSLNIFNTRLVLAHPDLATDADFNAVESVIAHEYFHNWTGNRITCRDWFQLSLKEGLTVFRDQEFSADMHSAAVQRIEDVLHLRAGQFPEDAGPLAHPIRPDNYIEINNFYTMTVYEKGSEVIRMLRTILGAETYRKATDLYFERHDGQAVTCEDFVRCMEDASGLDLTQFRLWYTQAGTPEVTAHGQYDAQARRYTLSLKQTVPPTPGQPEKACMHIPVSVALLGPNGDEMASQLLHLRETAQTFVFENIPSPPIPSILRGFSAPVRLKTDLSEDALRFLMVHDGDGFNRWEAGQTLALRTMGRMLDAREAGQAAIATDPGFVSSFVHLAEQGLDPRVDDSLLSLALSLPEVSIIGQDRAVVDPSAIHDVRERVIADIRAAGRSTLEAVYDRCQAAETGGMSGSDMARRSLKRAVLRLLMDGTRARDLYRDARTMTDRINALSVLVDLGGADCEAALADFYERFKAHRLVVDKWFARQAMSLRPDTLERVRALRQHPDFLLTNPNRVRSLYASFALNNPVRFHDPSGAGYALLGEVVKELNSVNPQIASRLLNPLREWRRYTPDRQAKMQAVLEDIRALPDLSNDVFEIVSKSLAA